MTRSRDTADTQDNLGGAVAPFVAGKNAVINGGFDVWQRGTSFVPSTTAFGPDRWAVYRNTTGSIASRQTPGATLPQFQYCARMQRDSGTTAVNSASYAMSLETSESLKYAGQTVTLSFYARAGANFSGSGASSMRIYLMYGTGTDQSVITGFTGNTFLVNGTVTAITTSWVRYSFTVAVSSTATQLGLELNALFNGTAGAADYFEVTGVQLELGAQATPFARAGGSIGGELALCQRYYYRTGVGSAVATTYGLGMATSTTAAAIYIQYPVTMRTNPSSVDYADLAVSDLVNYTVVLTSLALSDRNNIGGKFSANVASGLTQLRPAFLVNNTNITGYLGFSAEL
jgi:hypothetical protein